MINSSNLLLSVFNENTPNKIPFWFMRQAGRYLPEYRAIRKNFANFLEFCYTPEAACEITIQPITRFNMSAAIIFSDILVIPDALGVDVKFSEGHGPILQPITDLSILSKNRFTETLQPVYEAIKLTRAALPPTKDLIGFCGLPWTLACYMIEGKGSRDFANVRAVSYKHKEFFTGLIEILTNAVIEHSLAQIAAGAGIIQLFDSWAGVLSEQEFLDYSVIPSQKITAAIKEKYPHIPVIGFPRMAGSKIEQYAKITKVDAVSFDGSVSLDFIKNNLQPCVVAQGNLDNILFAEDKGAAVLQTKKILSALADKTFIFNLAHGILPHTPIDNVQAVCDVILEYEK
jgi:uroporphyrinogen decarboxylase